MAKAILIMDMPESCDMCDLTDSIAAWGKRIRYCTAPGVGEEVTDYISCRPDWCPLRVLPEKKVADKRLAISPLTEGYLKDFEKGWNACLDAILHK